ncbi:glycosyltransferase family 2 protein [Lachnobacterium bovis]|uniref:glycosyltransferase family 2 protein n=1 Tax=Lachnobacterium bovis TaxID=140626 RepID=UPI00069136CC|nr:glycosyltransferase family 2 protein [Lachnobacterium bovis]
MNYKAFEFKLKKAKFLYTKYGISGIANKIKDKKKSYETYNEWFLDKAVSNKELDSQSKKVLKMLNKPSIEVIILPGNDEACNNAIVSLENQIYTEWKSVILEKEQCSEYYGIKYEYHNSFEKMILDKDKSIAEQIQNVARATVADIILFTRLDQKFAPNYLYELANNYIDKKFDVFYTDSDCILDGVHCTPDFKPDYSVDMLRSCNYIGNVFAISKSTFMNIEFIKNLDLEKVESNIYSILLQCCENANEIVHLPKVLVHSVKQNVDISVILKEEKKVLEKHLETINQKADIVVNEKYSVLDLKYQLKEHPLVSILIPNKDQVETLARCIESIEKSTYDNYEVIIIENNSTDEKTFEYYEELKKKGIKVVVWQSIFNYSAINNFGASYAKGEYLVLLNNDIEITSPDWMERMLGNCMRSGVGIVGAHLYYPDKTVQHAGIVVGLGGVAQNLYPGLDGKVGGYNNRVFTQQNYSAITAAMFMVSRKIFDSVGGLEEKLQVAFNDVDFCLKVAKAGYWNVYDPNVTALHYESKSRGKEDTPEKKLRFAGEIAYMQEKWRKILIEGDPFYNINLSMARPDFALDGIEKAL